jgi:hypothetical protein
LATLYLCLRSEKLCDLRRILFSFYEQGDRAEDVCLSLTVMLQGQFNFCENRQRIGERGMNRAYRSFTFGKALSQQGFSQLRAIGVTMEVGE